MAPDAKLISEHFPRSTAYHPDWIVGGVGGGANPLWLAEWLSAALDLRRGMRVLDLGCGRALSSIFLRREFGVQVWAADLWYDPTENLQRVRDAGVEDGVFPMRADARALPFADQFFDAVTCIDAFPYFGTDELFVSSLARLVTPGGQIGVAGASLVQEIGGDVPAHLQAWWSPDLWCLHSAAWWQRHWNKTGIVAVEVADTMPDGWKRWLDWHHVVAPDNATEIAALTADRGDYLGYVRVVGRRVAGAALVEPVPSMNADYTKAPLLRCDS